MEVSVYLLYIDGMAKIILNSLILLSLSFVLYVIARALPRIEENPAGVPVLKEHWTSKYLEKADVWAQAHLEKFLRRAKIWILKLDNYVSKRLSSFKKNERKEVGSMMNDSDKLKSENTWSDTGA